MSSADASLLQPKNQGKPAGKCCPRRGAAAKTSPPPSATRRRLRAHRLCQAPGPLTRSSSLHCSEAQLTAVLRGLRARRAELLVNRRYIFTSTLFEIIWKCTIFYFRKYNLGTHPDFFRCSSGLRSSVKTAASTAQGIRKLSVLGHQQSLSQPALSLCFWPTLRFIPGIKNTTVVLTY